MTTQIGNLDNHYHFRLRVSGTLYGGDINATYESVSTTKSLGSFAEIELRKEITETLSSLKTVCTLYIMVINFLHD